MAAKIREAVARRKIFYNQIIEAYDLAVAAENEPTLRSLFARRFERVQDAYDGFFEQHISIVTSLSTQAGANLDEEDECRKSVEDKYYHIQLRYHEWFPKPVDADTSNNSVSTFANIAADVHIKLPKIPLRSFDGDFQHWMPFKQSFDAAIHNKSSLPKIDKFQYLVNSLKGEPLNLIKSLPLSDDNYDVAYNTLTKRYDDKRKLSSAYWQAIQSVPKLNSESSDLLRKMLDSFKQNRSALKALHFEENLEDFLWFNILFDRVDIETRKAFEAHCRTLNIIIPTFDQLDSFLESQCRILDAIKPQKSSARSAGFHSPNKSFRSPQQSLIINSPSHSNKISCPVCTRDHFVIRCPELLKKSPQERFITVKNLKLCLNCLKENHVVSHCPSKFTCRECKQSHHTLLHFKSSDEHKVNQNRSSLVDSSPIVIDNSAPTTLVSSGGNQVLLATVSCFVADKFGNLHRIRVIVDPGSQVSLITTSFAKQLGLPISKEQFPILGLGNTPSNCSSRGIVSTQLQSRFSNHAQVKVDLHLIPQICGNMPNHPIESDHWEHLNLLDLADPSWNRPGPIDALLGADIYSTILCPGIVNAADNQPVAVCTILGWILLGSIPNRVTSLHSLFAQISDIDQTIRQFWETEEISAEIPMSVEDQQAEAIYQRDVYRELNGRFGVSLPFKQNLPSFEGSKDIADRRWLATEKRLLVRPDLYKLYNEFMTDYLDAGHMSLVNLSANTTSSYFIPHHCIVKSVGEDTKIRVVFDASAKDVNGLSLNDCLLTGPKLQSDINTLLLRFRCYPVVFTCDVRQMYRQILIVPEHRNFQLIRFRFSNDEPISTFRLNTVTYGVSSSPYLALRTIQELVNRHRDEFPLATRAIETAMYVDDLVCGAFSETELLNLKQELESIFELGCFELRKWSSNSSTLLSTVPETHRLLSPATFDNDAESGIKILGLQWHAPLDSFSFSVVTKPTPCTKRVMLSEIARIYDPLGFIGPLLFFVKRLIQQLWVLGIDWDGTPPPSICEQWIRFKTELMEIRNCHIDRYLFLQTSSLPICELHAFCDASQFGFGAVLYLRFPSNGNYVVRFLISKSKVAPLKTLSITRLELCGAVLLSKLVDFAKRALTTIVNIDNIFAWTDSTTVLCWIRTPPYKLKTFVANRVVKIQEIIPPDSWNHVRSKDNPADNTSRGLFPAEWLDCSQWWAGPEFLKYPQSEWPCTNPGFPVDLEEVKHCFLNTMDIPEIEYLFKRFSSLRKILGCLAYCFRWPYSKLNSPIRGALTEFELHRALLRVVKYVQHQTFAKDIENLQENRRCSKPLRKLSPFLDDMGILRVGGRIEHSSLPFETKHPALLPRGHVLTNAIIDEIHAKEGHPGINTTTYLLQQRFYVLSARRAVRSRLSHCYRCFRLHPKAKVPIMGNLPLSRVSQAKAFSVSGVDFGGPFTLTMTRHRGARTSKACLCLFVCITTKAIHLEIVVKLCALPQQ